MKTEFAAAVTCMDGRIQSFINDYLKSRYNVSYVDVISEPGPNKILADATDQAVLSNIKKRLDISINKHGAQWVALVGHEDCAGNPVEKEAQRVDVTNGLNILDTMDFKVNFIGLWVDLAGNIEVIDERKGDGLE